MKIILALLISFNLFASTAKKYTAEVVPKKMTVQEKKARFYALIVPAVQKVHEELMQQYHEVKKMIDKGQKSEKIEALKEKYKVKTDKELLLALKPHPSSIAIAQAAMESSWATSRFFVKAKNIFGMWSVNPKEPRIAASEKRGGTRTIWLKKFNTIEDSVRAYYETIARAPAYKEFRKTRYATDDPYIIVQKLDKYSEMGAQYPKELASVIRYNKLHKYDMVNTQK